MNAKQNAGIGSIVTAISVIIGFVGSELGWNVPPEAWAGIWSGITTLAMSIGHWLSE